MFVLKRDGAREPVQFDKITKRIERLRAMAPPLDQVDSIPIAQKVVAGVYPGSVVFIHDPERWQG